MPSTEVKPRPPRAKLSQTMRVRTHWCPLPEEICVSENVSRRGFYFETLLERYFVGMPVHVTRNFHAGDLLNSEEPGEVVRVERLRNGKWGVAVRILTGDSRPGAPEAEAARVTGKQEHRRTRRARIKIPLLLYGNTRENRPFFVESHTIEINAHGALVATNAIVRPGDRLFLTNETNGKTEKCVVLAARAKRGPGADDAVAVAFGVAAPSFWRPRVPLTRRQTHC